MNATRHRVLAALMALLCLASPLSAEDVAMPAPPQSLAPLIDRTAPAVVNIYAQKLVRSRSATRYLDGSAFWRLFRDTLLFGYGQDRVENSLGSGVIVRSDGIIVTNHHVIGGAEGIQVALPDGRIYGAEVLLDDRRSDVAVLRVTAAEPLPFIEFGDSENLRVGDPVVAIGNPFGLGQTVTTGIVSALARTTFGVGDLRYFIQTDAAINPGNSGGAQIALDGKLVGINTAIYSTSGGSQGLGFAIPSSMVRQIVDSAVHGKPVVHPWIGISGQIVPPDFAARLGLSGIHGVLVAAVHKAGPAQAAGFRGGDVILAIDGTAVNDPQALNYRISIRQPGETVQLTVRRGSNTYLVPVTAVAPPAVPSSRELRLGPFSPLRGARIASLSPAFAQEIGADSGVTGVAVLDVAPGSAAARLGLRAGDIIRGTDYREIATADELQAFRIEPFKPWSLIVSRAGSYHMIGHRASGESLR